MVFSLVLKVNCSSCGRYGAWICDWICGRYFSFSSKLIVDMIGPQPEAKAMAVDASLDDDGGFRDDSGFGDDGGFGGFGSDSIDEEYNSQPFILLTIVPI